MNITRRSIYDDIKPNKDYKEFCKEVFFHPVSESKRLSKKGFMMLRKHYKHHIVEVLAGSDKREIPAKNYIFLARYCKAPYYIGTDKLVFFDEDEAFLFKLCDGDIENVDQVTQDENNA